MGLELYLDLLSQPCRSIYIFARTNNIPFEFKHVELFKGATGTARPLPSCPRSGWAAGPGRAAAHRGPRPQRPSLGSWQNRCWGRSRRRGAARSSPVQVSGREGRVPPPRAPVSVRRAGRLSAPGAVARSPGTAEPPGAHCALPSGQKGPSPGPGSRSVCSRGPKEPLRLPDGRAPEPGRTGAHSSVRSAPDQQPCERTLPAAAAPAPVRQGNAGPRGGGRRLEVASEGDHLFRRGMQSSEEAFPSSHLVPSHLGVKPARARTSGPRPVPAPGSAASPAGKLRSSKRAVKRSLSAAVWPCSSPGRAVSIFVAPQGKFLQPSLANQSE